MLPGITLIFGAYTLWDAACLQKEVLVTATVRTVSPSACQPLWGIEKTTFVSARSSRRVLITYNLYCIYSISRIQLVCPRPQCSCSGSFSAHHVRGVWHPSGSDYLPRHMMFIHDQSPVSEKVATGGLADWKDTFKAFSCEHLTAGKKPMASR